MTQQSGCRSRFHDAAPQILPSHVDVNSSYSKDGRPQIKGTAAPLICTRYCYPARVVQTCDSGTVLLILAADSPRSVEMSRFGFLSACFAAILLALSDQDAMA